MTTLQERLRRPPRGPLCDEAADRIDALEARVASLTKDAERYRWLRRTQMEIGLPASTVAMLVGDVTEIDEAMKETP